MEMVSELVDGLPWPALAAQLRQEGYALLPGLFDAAAQDALRACLAPPAALPRTSLNSDAQGRAEIFRFEAALPPMLAALVDALYAQLAPLARHWQAMLGVAGDFPDDFPTFAERQRRAGYHAGLSYLSRMCKDDYFPLHQCVQSEWLFPFQLVALLSQPDNDFGGGQFVMTEQRPRMQSRPIVLPLQAGDAALIATGYRPCRGNNGYYRVNLKHAVSTVSGGERIGLELSFHAAA